MGREGIRVRGASRRSAVERVSVAGELEWGGRGLGLERARDALYRGV
jgi:hypothetical protein